MKGNAKNLGRLRRKKRVRKNISGTAECPRLSVFKSNRNFSVQVIDDVNKCTLVAASTYEKDLKVLKEKSSKVGAKKVGELIAERAKAKGISKIVFDRNGYKYHGCVRELADAARGKGLRF